MRKLNKKGKMAVTMLALGAITGFGLTNHATASHNIYETVGTMVSTDGIHAEFKLEIGSEYHIFEVENKDYEKHEIYVFQMDSMGTENPEDDKVLKIKHL